MSAFDRAVVHLLPLVPKPIVARVAGRYVAGETLSDALATVARLNAQGAGATLDILGEHVSDRAETQRITRDYVDVVEAVAARELDSGVSVKPSHLGLDIDEGLCLANIETIVETARASNRFVRIDMEDHRSTDATLRLYETLRRRHPNTGVVLQAYLIRTLRDIDQLSKAANPPTNVRLCKGIYVEPSTVAWQDFGTVRANFTHAVEKMFRRGVFVAIATHDPHLVWAAMALIDKLGVPRDRYEFQTLLGVDAELQELILREGHRLRVYVPFGDQWYDYSMRRLRENPKIARNVALAFFGRRNLGSDGVG